MNCPICNREMQEGKLLATGSRLGWVPKDTHSLWHIPTLSQMQDIGHYQTGLLAFNAHAPGAYYCEHCKKVTGIFDVTF